MNIRLDKDFSDLGELTRAAGLSRSETNKAVLEFVQEEAPPRSHSAREPGTER